MISFIRMILRGEFLALNHSENNRVMKPIKISGIIIGMTLIIGGLLLPVRPTLANTPNKQQQAVSTKENDLQKLYEQGVNKIVLGDYQGAISDLGRVIVLNPEYVEAYCNRGMAHIGLGNPEKAIADFNLALQISPDHADAYNRRGVTLAQQGNLNQALADFDQAISFDSNFADAYYNRGKARTELGNYQGAMSDYNLAIKLDPNLAEAYGNRGFIHAHWGNSQKALKDLQQAAKLFLDAGNIAGYQQTLLYIQMIK